MNAAAATIILLVISNVFMTLAWYGHLRMQQTDMAKNWPLLVVILVSWGIALFEYCSRCRPTGLDSARTEAPSPSSSSRFFRK